MEELKGNMDLLTGKIQQAYGHGKEKAEQEFKDFKNSIAAGINKVATSAADTKSEMKDEKNEIN